MALAAGTVASLAETFVFEQVNEFVGVAYKDRGKGRSCGRKNERPKQKKGGFNEPRGLNRDKSKRAKLSRRENQGIRAKQKKKGGPSVQLTG